MFRINYNRVFDGRYRTHNYFEKISPEKPTSPSCDEIIQKFESGDATVRDLYEYAFYNKSEEAHINIIEYITKSDIPINLELMCHTHFIGSTYEKMYDITVNLLGVGNNRFAWTTILRPKNKREKFYKEELAKLGIKFRELPKYNIMGKMVSSANRSDFIFWIYWIL